MKKLASILAVTLAAGVLATGCGSSSGSASKDSSSDSRKTVIKAATGANAKPYVYVGDDDKPAGYDVDVLNAVFDKLPDYELEYEVTDFGSVLSGLNSGNYQIGVNNFSYNEDRGASYLYSYPYDKISYVSLGNAFIGLIKGTSLAFVCSVVEMTAEGKILAGRNYRYFEVYISLAIIYWVITFVLERVISYLEKKLRVPEDAPALLDIRDTEVE